MQIFEQLLIAVKTTTPIEWFAVTTGVAYVIFAAQRKMICWFFGLISSGAYVYICSINHLFIETGLQVFYVIMAIYGWIFWNKSNPADLPVRFWALRYHVLILISGTAISFVMGYVFKAYTTQANPYLDASIGTFSLIATFLSAHRFIENWIYWIIIDFSAIFLYGYQELAMTAALFLLFTIMAIFGLIQWMRQYKSQMHGALAGEYLSNDNNTLA